MQKRTIIIVGATGRIGRWVAQLVCNQVWDHIVLVARSAESLLQVKGSLANDYPGLELSTYCGDIIQENVQGRLLQFNPELLLDCAGALTQPPFLLAEFCIKHGIHYIDNAFCDEMVVQISKLDNKSKKAGVTTISGAGSLLGLTSAVSDSLMNAYARLDSLEIAYHCEFEKGWGKASIRSYLHQVGNPAQSKENGCGAQSLHKRYYGDNLGYLWQASLSCPELLLLIQRYKGLKKINCFMGFDSLYQHVKMWCLAWMFKKQWLRKWLLSPTIIPQLIRCYASLGKGKKAALIIRMQGSDKTYQPLKTVWSLINEQGKGDFMNATSIAIVANKIAQYQLKPGAFPCVGLYSLSEYAACLPNDQFYILQDTYSD